MGKIKRYYTYAVAYIILAIASFSTPVYASATTSNAVQDIMNNERFQGAISSIEWLTTRVDYWFTMIISATAFFIISSALLKNACAGAYCSNHKFWDKVAEAHEKNDSLNLAGIKDYFTGKQFMQTTGGGIRDALLGLVPNIKALTDFDDADIEPKQYFMKAIPQMLACIIIGVFIYNGYYRDTASTVGSFGSEICNRVFSSVDPTAFVDKLSQTTSTPENIYENDQTLQGEDIYALSSSIYKAYLSIATDLSSTEAKTSLMRDSEKLAYDILNNSTFAATFYGEARVYDFKVTNLRVTPCVSKAAQNMDQIHSESADQSTNSKYSCSVYKMGPSTALQYVSESYQCMYVTFVMQGSQKETTQQGLSSVTAAAGSWNASPASTLAISVPFATYKQSETKDGSTALLTTKNVPISEVLNSQAINSSVSAYCADNNLTLTTGSIKITGYNGYNAGSGQAPCLKWSKAQRGSTLNFTVSVTYKATSSTSNGEATERLTIPCQATLN